MGPIGRVDEHDRLLRVRFDHGPDLGHETRLVGREPFGHALSLGGARFRERP
jgi:hypothetical protein